MSRNIGIIGWRPVLFPGAGYGVSLVPMCWVWANLNCSQVLGMRSALALGMRSALIVLRCWYEVSLVPRYWVWANLNCSQVPV